MMSDILLAMADRFARYAMDGRAIEPEHAGCIAQGLADVAKQVRQLEDRPFIIETEMQRQAERRWLRSRRDHA